ncbi:MAG TPA: D-alanyl-D-alanine carboxypeptidase/D-alanyl-D-alanine-endopeptidase, partial [Usitatibacter sp.]|nr:D-alanyl-D-alanine carboxypeptidase/D-alanyl-D-alanine-endopeptidase [Usitatibacter sp.]
DGPPVLVHQIAVPMNPASVMKLVTTYAALDQLGPAFTFHTDVLYTGELADGVLTGDLILRGGGDPKLTYERLWQLAHQLRSRGVREIRGDVVLDRGYFAAVPFDPASFDNEPRRAYNVAPDALLVNFNAIAFHFMPDASGVRVTAEPDLPGVQVVTSVKPNADPCGAWRRDLRYEVQATGLLATVSFDGSYPVECGERTWPLAVLDGQRFAQEAWRWVWSEAGGTLRGNVRAGTTPAEAHLLLRHESEPLATLVRDMNKFSNNVMARHLFLALSAEREGQGRAQDSAAIVREWLHERGIVAPELVLENGSGLSRNERVSAATLAALLRSAWKSPVMSELVSSLPIISVDGTLRRHANAASGRAHLKGGTLDGVQSLAGYVLDRNGRRWIVVMMLNHARANAAQPALDALVEWVYRQGAGKGGER